MALRPFARHQKRKADDETTPNAADEFAQFFSNEPRAENPATEAPATPAAEPSAPAVTMEEQSAAGWYPDTKDPGLMRYWDGFHLTGQTMRVGPPPAAAEPVEEPSVQATQPSAAAPVSSVIPQNPSGPPARYATDLLAPDAPAAPLLGSRLLSDAVADKTTAAEPPRDAEADRPAQGHAMNAEPQPDHEAVATPPVAEAPPAPAIPMGPVTPAFPTAPAAPVTPVSPAVPTAPVAPVSPAVPTAPVAPVTPAFPIAPVAPVSPAVPTAPVAPPAPVVPVTPDAPPTGVAPDTIVAPAALNTSATPAVPVESIAQDTTTPEEPAPPPTVPPPVTSDMGGKDKAATAEHGPTESPAPEPSAATAADQTNSWAERTEQAVTKAQAVGTPEAWEEAAKAAAVLSEMAQTMQAAADIRQSARQLEKAAEEAQRRADEAEGVAAEAQRSVQETAQAAKQAAEAAESAARKAEEARQKAERTAEATPRVAERAKDAAQAAAEAKRRAQQVEEIVARARKADTPEAWSEARRSVERTAESDGRD